MGRSEQGRVRYALTNSVREQSIHHGWAATALKRITGETARLKVDRQHHGASPEQRLIHEVSIWFLPAFLTRSKHFTKVKGCMVKSCTAILSMLICVACPAMAREKTDVIVMQNGDRFTCEIKSLNADVLYVSIDYALGTVSIDWSKVDHLESNQLFVIKTQSGEVYSGTLSMPKTAGERPVSIEVLDPVGSKVELPRTEVARMDQGFPGFWQRFNGSFGLGAIYNKGNKSTQYSLTSDIDYPRERWAASLSFDSTLSSSQGTSPSSRNQVDASAYRLMRWNNWYYKGTADFLQSSEQGIDLQSTFAGGVGRYLKNSNHVSITLTGGFAYQRIDYQQRVSVAEPENVTSAWISGQAKVFHFDRTNLVATASLLPALSNPGRLHFNVNTTYYVKIWGKFNFNASFYGNWDNQPPHGFSGSDYGTSMGVNWTFGNR